MYRKLLQSVVALGFALAAFTLAAPGDISWQVGAAGGTQDDISWTSRALAPTDISWNLASDPDGDISWDIAPHGSTTTTA